MNALAAKYADALWDAARGLDAAAVQRLVDGFIDLMAKRGHLTSAPDVIQALERRMRKEAGVIEVKLTTASEIGKAEKHEVEKSLKKSLGAEIELETATDPSLIGGAVLRTGDTLVDSSIKHRLELLKVKLAE